MLGHKALCFVKPFSRYEIFKVFLFWRNMRRYTCHKYTFCIHTACEYTRIIFYSHPRLSPLWSFYIKCTSYEYIRTSEDLHFCLFHDSAWNTKQESSTFSVFLRCSICTTRGQCKWPFCSRLKSNWI